MGIFRNSYVFRFLRYRISSLLDTPPNNYPQLSKLNFRSPKTLKFPDLSPICFKPSRNSLESSALGKPEATFQDDQTLRRRAIIIVPLKPGKTRIVARVETRDLDFHEIPARSLEPSSLRSANLHTFTGEIHPSKMFSLQSAAIIRYFRSEHVSFHALLTR